LQGRQLLVPAASPRSGGHWVTQVFVFESQWPDPQKPPPAGLQGPPQLPYLSTPCPLGQVEGSMQTPWVVLVHWPLPQL
jgi:hypothetical protein